MQKLKLLAERVIKFLTAKFKSETKTCKCKCKNKEQQCSNK
jgi:hypothetical protein